MSKPKSGQNLNTKGSDVISKTASTSKKATNFLKKFKKAKKGAKTAKKLGKLGKTIKAPAFCLKAGGAATGVVIVFICIAILTCMLNPLNIFFNSLLNLKTADQKIMEILSQETTMSNSTRKKIATEVSKRWQCSEKTPSFLSEAYSFLNTIDVAGWFKDPQIEWRERVGFFDEDDTLDLQYINTYPSTHADAKTVTGATAHSCIINVSFASESSGQVDYSNKDVDSDTTVENISVDQIVLAYANAVESALAYYDLDTQDDPADDEKFDTSDQRQYDETSLFEEAKNDDGSGSGELQLNENGKEAIESSDIADDSTSEKIYEELRKIVTTTLKPDGTIDKMGTPILTVDNGENILYPKSGGQDGIYSGTTYELMDADFAQNTTVTITDDWIDKRLYVYDLNAKTKIDLRKYKKTEIKEAIEKMVDKGQCVFSTDESKTKLGTDKDGNDIEPTETCTKSEAKIAFWSYVANMYNSGLYQRGASETTHVYQDKYGNVFGIDENSKGTDGNTAIADDGTYMTNSKGEETCMYLRIMQGLPTTLTKVSENTHDYSENGITDPSEVEIDFDSYYYTYDEDGINGSPNVCRVENGVDLSGSGGGWPNNADAGHCTSKAIGRTKPNKMICTSYASSRFWEVNYPEEDYPLDKGWNNNLHNNHVSGKPDVYEVSTDIEDVKPYSIFSISYPNSTLSHVLFVEGIDDDGSVVVSDANCRNTEYGWHCEKYDSIEECISTHGGEFVATMYPTSIYQ